MRILGMAERFDKLKKPRFIDFRLRRRDKDWQVGEIVQVVYKARSKQREVLGIARIISIELKHFYTPSPQGRRITYQEAQRDGFDSEEAMEKWFLKTHGPRVRQEPLNKLTLEWVNDADTKRGVF